MNILKLYQDFSVPTAGAGDKHYRDGWIQTRCPFCSGSEGYHLGYNITDDYFNCWRCGFKPTGKALMGILNVSYSQVRRIQRDYKGRVNGAARREAVKRATVKRKGLKTPPKLCPIRKIPYVYKYLTRPISKKGRGFAPGDLRLIEKRYGIKATGRFSKLDNMKLSYRVFAPIPWEGSMVSWQTRDATLRSNVKYLACPKARERVEHKHILYFPPEDKSAILLVEGVFDVWKIYVAGFPIVSTAFGVEIKDSQVLLLKRYKKIYLWLDPDKAGRSHMNSLENRLLFAGKDVEVIRAFGKTDPGDMNKRQIREILSVYGLTPVPLAA